MGKKKDIIKAALTATKLVENTGKKPRNTGKTKPPPPDRPGNLKPAWKPGQSGNPDGRPPKDPVVYVKRLKTLRGRYSDADIKALSQDLLVSDPEEITKALINRKGTALELLMYKIWDTGINTGDFRLTYAVLQLAGHGRILKEQPMEPPPGDDDQDGQPQRAVLFLPVQRPET